MKIYIFISLLAFLSIDTFGNEPAIQTLFKNKNIFREYTINCQYNSRGKTIKCFFPDRDFFLENIDKPITFWKTNESKYINSFLSLCNFCGYIQKDSSFVINDDLLVDILAKLITGKDIYSEKAVDILTNRTSIEKLFKWKKDIKNRILEKKISNLKLAYLYALLDSNLTSDDTLLNSYSTDLKIKAKVGDTNIQNNYYDKYKNAASYLERSNLLHNIFYIGNPELIKRVLVNFNAPYYDTVWSANRKTDIKPCINESIRYQIIIELRRYFPEEPLFNTKLNQLKDRYGVNDSSLIKNYFKEIIEWITINYKINPINKDVLPVLKGFCVKYNQ